MCALPGGAVSAADVSATPLAVAVPINAYVMSPTSASSYSHAHTPSAHTPTICQSQMMSFGDYMEAQKQAGAGNAM